MSTRKSVLITGCSEGGLGDALAREFNRKGFHVIATARNPQKMAHLAALGADTVVLDVQSPESRAAAVEEVSQLTGGRLDILINNSGIAYSVPIIDADPSKMKEIFDVNVFGYVLVMQAFFPLLQKASPGSMVVNNGSIASVVSVPLQGIYGATKAAISSITNASRLELEPFGIKVVELKTGAVRSRIWENQKTATTSELPPNSHYELARDVIENLIGGESFTQRASDPDDWARQVVSDLTRTKNPAAIIWRGADAMVGWIVSTFAPHGATDFVAKKAGGMDVFAARLNAQKKDL